MLRGMALCSTTIICCFPVSRQLASVSARGLSSAFCVTVIAQCADRTCEAKQGRLPGRLPDASMVDSSSSKSGSPGHLEIFPFLLLSLC